ncbi:polyphosphate glucokinase [Polaribacter sp. Hel1_33_78]|jgi:polyphosphate glucokinase|uniref:polyphosphate--glucose phosphotransferase n=1 Tax=unclassified Polaribacter TaxID=196858 RepID=UPI00052DC153|nr:MULTISPECIES: ROK family protein [unclassified Polaribacter]KGL60902.1 polyphosphate glucokinase [Polaribacter sp. Hel1_33_49]MBT3741660.1 ROK family protein [Polaribacter sp.]MDG1193995.1 ROK family protein [Polaribacter sp.]MDG1403342.1 ROK family protein [Polaribacter sp.]PKV64810.1 polyphosphate glucokinase [Polaribacter sp. Hel1_33_96]
MKVLGIDIGGSGIKAAIIDTKTGKLLSDRHRIATPKPATPENVVKVIKEMIVHFDWKKAVGCSFPTTIVDGKCIHSGNLSEKWLNVKVDKLFKKECKLPFYVSNDADLAGVAEVNLGAGKGEKGVVIAITIGTGIGSGLFFNGKLIPNLEIGKMLHTDGRIIEYFTADSVRKREELSLKQWALRFDILLNYARIVFSPSLIILGGGISKKYNEFKEYLTTDVNIKVAEFRNNAGIIGAAMYASKKENK